MSGLQAGSLALRAKAARLKGSALSHAEVRFQARSRQRQVGAEGFVICESEHLHCLLLRALLHALLFALGRSLKMPLPDF